MLGLSGSEGFRRGRFSAFLIMFSGMSYPDSISVCKKKNYQNTLYTYILLQKTYLFLTMTFRFVGENLPSMMAL